jgi:hypothetical protein
MAEIRAFIRADHATMVMGVLNARATRPAGPADTRGIDARRADAFVDIFAAALADPELPETQPQRTRAQVHVTVGYETLLGLDERPGELRGYGPIPAALARRIAADAVWRRLITDPVDGGLLDYGRTAHRPPADFAAYVTARDQVCAFPTCRMPAHRCDLDHTIPFPEGCTSPDNLGPLCPRHHRLKTVGNWQLTRAPDGTVTWTSAAGKTYHVRPPKPPRSLAVPAGIMTM